MRIFTYITFFSKNNHTKTLIIILPLIIMTPKICTRMLLNLLSNHFQESTITLVCMANYGRSVIVITHKPCFAFVTTRLPPRPCNTIALISSNSNAFISPPPSKQLRNLDPSIPIQRSTTIFYILLLIYLFRHTIF